MRLIDVLETKHQIATKTAALRDYQVLLGDLQKIASDQKTAGPVGEFASKAINLLKAPFAKTPAESIMHNSNSALMTALNSMNEVALNMAKDKDAFRLWAMGDQGKGTLDQISKLKGALQRPDSAKMPFKAMAGIVGAVGAGSAAMAMVDRRVLETVHRENLELIQGDKNIPHNLRERAKEMYGVLVTYAPTIAKDSVFAKDFTKNLIRHDTVDHKVISDLISAEKAYREAKGRKPEFLQAIGDLTLKSTGWM